MRSWTFWASAICSTAGRRPSRAGRRSAWRSFLLLDEPLSSLDPGRREEILTVIERMKRDLAMPMLYVSHDRYEVDRLADQIIAL